MKKLLNSFKYAYQGIIAAFKSEQNLKIHLSIALLVIIFGFFLKLSFYEWLIIILSIGLVLMAELFNTALETCVNLVTMKYNEKAKKAKDIAAGSVLIISLFVMVIGLIIFLPKIINLL